MNSSYFFRGDVTSNFEENVNQLLAEHERTKSWVGMLEKLMTVMLTATVGSFTYFVATNNSESGKVEIGSLTALTMAGSGVLALGLLACCLNLNRSIEKIRQGNRKVTIASA